MKKNIYYSLLISAMVSVSVAEETRQVDKHEHGVGELNIAIEGNAIDFEFFIPGADIVGFEYEAKTESDIALVNAALEKFGNFDNIFSLPESSNCNLVNSEIKVTKQLNDAGTNADGKMTVTMANLESAYPEIQSATFESFDQEELKSLLWFVENNYVR